MLAWILANYGIVASVLLGISESLAVIFPASTGAGGIIAGLISALKSLGAKPPVGQ